MRKLNYLRWARTAVLACLLLTPFVSPTAWDVCVGIFAMLGISIERELERRIAPEYVMDVRGAVWRKRRAERKSQS